MTARSISQSQPVTVSRSIIGRGMLHDLGFWGAIARVGLVALNIEYPFRISGVVRLGVTVGGLFARQRSCFEGDNGERHALSFMDWSPPAHCCAHRVRERRVPISRQCRTASQRSTRVQWKYAVGEVEWVCINKCQNSRPVSCWTRDKKKSCHWPGCHNKQQGNSGNRDN